jgi:hypothetical protein
MAAVQPGALAPGPDVTNTAWTVILVGRQVCKRLDFMRRSTVPLSVVISAYVAFIMFCSLLFSLTDLNSAAVIRGILLYLTAATSRFPSARLTYKIRCEINEMYVRCEMNKNIPIAVFEYRD